MKEVLSDAVILMAGSGSRLRRGGENCPKPLLTLAGRPLICYTLENQPGQESERFTLWLGLKVLPCARA